MTRPTLTEDDWAMMYLSWLNNLPLSDSLKRWESLKKRAGQDGHCGSCVKQPGSCSLCTVEECLKGGKDMAAVWQVEASTDEVPDENVETHTILVKGKAKDGKIYEVELDLTFPQGTVILDVKKK